LSHPVRQPGLAAGFRFDGMNHRVVRLAFPGALYARAAAVWHLRGQFTRLASQAFQHGWPEMLIAFGAAPGDTLLCSAVLHELRQRTRKKLWIMSGHAELFEGNPDVNRVVPFDDFFRDYVRVGGGQVPYWDSGPVVPDGDQPPKQHLIAEFCEYAGVEGPIKLRPYLQLRDEEIAKSAWAEGMIAIQSSGLGAQFPMLNKQWYPERFQALVNRLAGGWKLIQLGSKTDPLLSGTLDLRGKTTIRETAALLHHCRLYVGNVGFLMHLARAVECPSVIVYGGREAPGQSGYGCNLNLYSALPCAPCWLWNKCAYNRACMDRVTVEDVTAAVQEMMARPRNPLPEDVLTL